MSAMNRRSFVKSSLAAAAGLATMPGARVRGANERVVIGVMGLGGRGTQLTGMFAGRKDTHIAYLCDVNTRKFSRAAEAVKQTQAQEPKLVQDFRRILDDKHVDVLITATPDHWHGLATVKACQAGKDVYVEKPMSHNIFEGRQMITAARKYKRVVQVGMQSRSALYAAHARNIIQSGKLGEVHLVRVYNMMPHSKMNQGQNQSVPDYLDYDLWCGPAAKLPYNPSRRWLNFWEYSCGPIAGDAVHQLDLARFLIGDPVYPKSVSQVGAISSLKDGRDTPDTQMATFEYDDFTLTLEASLWSPYMKKTPQSVRNSDQFPDFPFSSTKIEILGDQGFMYFGRHGGGFQVFDADGKMIHSEYGRQSDPEHQDNFIGCIKNRKRANADVEIGHHSVMLCHLANISYRVGNLQLALDREAEKITNCNRANKYLKRDYRSPYIVAEEV